MLGLAFLAAVHLAPGPRREVGLVLAALSVACFVVGLLLVVNAA
jgi:hypothetical protein